MEAEKKNKFQPCWLVSTCRVNEDTMDFLGDDFNPRETVCTSEATRDAEIAEQEAHVVSTFEQGARAMPCLKVNTSKPLKEIKDRVTGQTTCYVSMATFLDPETQKPEWSSMSFASKTAAQEWIDFVHLVQDKKPIQDQAFLKRVVCSWCGPKLVRVRAIQWRVNSWRVNSDCV
jgi:hypothetical protein